jgi:hypothetical protein
MAATLKVLTPLFIIMKKALTDGNAKAFMFARYHYSLHSLPWY